MLKFLGLQDEIEVIMFFVLSVFILVLVCEVADILCA